MATGRAGGVGGRAERAEHRPTRAATATTTPTPRAVSAARPEQLTTVLRQPAGFRAVQTAGGGGPDPTGPAGRRTNKTSDNMLFGVAGRCTPSHSPSQSGSRRATARRHGDARRGGQGGPRGRHVGGHVGGLRIGAVCAARCAVRAEQARAGYGPGLRARQHQLADN